MSVNPFFVRPAVALQPEGAPNAVELVARRRANSKTFSLGDGRHQILAVPGTVHYKEDYDSLQEPWKEIDLTIDQFGVVVTAPYEISVRLAGGIGYSYLSKRGGRVDVDLMEIDGSPVDFDKIRASIVGNQVLWDGAAEDLRLKLLLQPTSVEILKLLETEQAPRTFLWRVREDVDTKANFRRLTRGIDATQHALEITTTVLSEQILREEGREIREFLYKETWTGRTSTIANPKTRQKVWQDSADYPVIVDASTSEDIGNTADDGYENVGNTSWYSTANTDWCGHWITAETGYSQNVGLRFRTLGVPQGAITTATLKFKIVVINGSPQCTIYADDVDDAALWENGNLPSGIAQTAASVVFSGTATGSTTIGITGIVQEVLSRTGWSSGNDIRFAFINNATTGTNEIGIHDLTAGAVGVAQLAVTWGAVSQSGTFTADATIKAPQSGSFLANATIKAPQSGSLAASATIKASQDGTVDANAVILRGRTGTLTNDAAIKRAGESGSLTADAIVKRAGMSGGVTADAAIKRAGMSGSISGDATIRASQGGGITADAAVKRIGTSESFVIDAIILHPRIGTLNADAIILRARTGTLTSNAIIQAAQTGMANVDAAILRARTGTATANAIVKQAGMSGGVTADAAIKRAGMSGSISGDATIRASQGGGITADAAVKRIGTSESFVIDAIILHPRIGTLNADAIILRARTGTLTSNAIIQAAQTGMANVDAAILRARTGTATANATLKAGAIGTLNANATIRAAQSGSFTANAAIGGISTVTLDAAIEAAQAGTLTIDTVIELAGTGAVTLDAYISATVKSKAAVIRTTPGLVPSIGRAMKI